MQSALPNQILVKRFDFVDIEFEELSPFYSSCKMIGHDIFKCRRHPDNLNNTIKLSIVLFKLVVV